MTIRQNSKIMKPLRVLFIFTLSLNCFSQNMTYSSAEGVRFQQLNNAWGSAQAYGSKQYYHAILDSFNQFLKKYPNSIYKVGILNYKFDLTSIISSDEKLLSNIADTILFYDSLDQTKLGIAEIFIKKNLNAERGVRLIHEILPNLTVPNQRYKAFNNLASFDISKGDFLSAKTNLRSAIAVDSTRYEAWYSYLSLLKSREEMGDVSLIDNKIKMLQENELSNFGIESSSGSNLLKNINLQEFKDIKGESISFSSFNKKIVVLNCFAFWCGSCVPELQMLHSLSKEFPQVIFLYVNMPPDFIGGNPKDTKLFLSKPKYKYLKGKTILFPPVNFFNTISIKGVPTTLIIDQQGIVRFDYLGFVNGSEEIFRNNLKQLSKE